MQNFIYQIKDISFAYDGRKILDSLSFDVRPGEIIGILGPNGAGKTTLLKLMMKMFPPESGEILLLGKSLLHTSLNETARAVSWVPQESYSVFAYSVKDIVMMGRYPYIEAGIYETRHDHEVTKAVMKQTGVWDLRDAIYNELSMGERQRVIIARALAQETSALLLDEPTSSLDMAYQYRVLKILKDLNVLESKTLVLVTHDLNLAGMFCTRLIFLKNGRVFCEGPTHEILTEDVIRETYGIPFKIHTDETAGRRHIHYDL